MTRYLSTALIFAAAFLYSVSSFPQANRPNLEKANRAYQEKNWRDAAAAYESIVSADPASSFAWLQLGISRHKLGQYEQAVAAYKHIENDPQFGAPALYREAASLAKLNRNADALILLDKAVDAGFARPQIIQQDPDLAALHGDPSFAKAVDKADRKSTSNLPRPGICPIPPWAINTAWCSISKTPTTSQKTGHGAMAITICPWSSTLRGNIEYAAEGNSEA